MSQSFIALGDHTSHGGTVISADFTVSIDGKYLARVGDLTVCPKCKGTFPITSGTPDMTSMGQAPARSGDKTACGAILIASQSRTTWSPESTRADSAGIDKSDALKQAAAIATPTKSGICLECLLAAATAGNAMVIRE